MSHTVVAILIVEREQMHDAIVVIDAVWLFGFVGYGYVL
jgi:hypothetical protein